MNRIPDHTIATVREQADIETAVGEYVQLRSAGGLLKGLCPFHDDTVPSFNINPKRGMWYCFACGEGGDVIAFLQRKHGFTFEAAVRDLADRYGVDVELEEFDDTQTH